MEVQNEVLGNMVGKFQSVEQLNSTLKENASNITSLFHSLPNKVKPANEYTVYSISKENDAWQNDFDHIKHNNAFDND